MEQNIKSNFTNPSNISFFHSGLGPYLDYAAKNSIISSKITYPTLTPTSGLKNYCRFLILKTWYDPRAVVAVSWFSSKKLSYFGTGHSHLTSHIFSVVLVPLCTIIIPLKTKRSGTLSLSHTISIYVDLDVLFIFFPSCLYNLNLSVIILWKLKRGKLINALSTHEANENAVNRTNNYASMVQSHTAKKRGCTEGRTRLVNVWWIECAGESFESWPRYLSV